ncbi:MAG: DUF6702 family protein [Bacteroidota bacterium]
MGKKFVLALLWVCVFPNMLNAHQFYISITSVRHHAETQKLTVRIKVFVNDLEEAIFQEQGIRIGLWTNTPVENVESYLERYIFSKLFISVDDARVPLKFVNQMVEPTEVLEDHVLVCKLEAYNIPKITTIKIHNSLLTESIDSQINIVNIRANGTKKVINLDGKIPEDQIAFD